MNELKNALQGKKTYIFLALYAVLVLITGEEPPGGGIAGVDPEAIEKALLAGAIAAIKGAFDRFVAK